MWRREAPRGTPFNNQRHSAAATTRDARGISRLRRRITRQLGCYGAAYDSKGSAHQCGIAKVVGEFAENLFMITSNARAADVISAIGETLGAICKVRGIEFESLDEAMLDKLLWTRSTSTLAVAGLLPTPRGCSDRSRIAYRWRRGRPMRSTAPDPSESTVKQGIRANHRP